MSTDWHEFHKLVYAKDTPSVAPYGYIQWKGTDVCIDIHCTCGERFHFDGMFFSFFQCPKCGQPYATGCNVKLIPLSQEEIALGGIQDFLEKEFS